MRYYFASSYGGFYLLIIAIHREFIYLFILRVYLTKIVIANSCQCAKLVLSRKELSVEIKYRTLTLVTLSLRISAFENHAHLSS